MRTRFIATISLGLFAVLGLADLEAVGKEKAKSKYQSQFSPLILELKAAKHWLNEANHNYNGHRAAAVTEVNHALHQLENHPHHKAHHKEIANQKHAVHEPQKVSDAELVLAHQIIKDVARKLATLTDDTHSAKAVKHLREADKQIGLGLAHVRKK